MPSTWRVTQSPVASMDWAAWAWVAVGVVEQWWGEGGGDVEDEPEADEQEEVGARGAGGWRGRGVGQSGDSAVGKTGREVGSDGRGHVSGAWVEASEGLGEKASSGISGGTQVRVEVVRASPRRASSKHSEAGEVHAGWMLIGLTYAACMVAGGCAVGAGFSTAFDV